MAVLVVEEVELKEIDLIQELISHEELAVAAAGVVVLVALVVLVVLVVPVVLDQQVVQEVLPQVNQVDQHLP